MQSLSTLVTLAVAHVAVLAQTTRDHDYATGSTRYLLSELAADEAREALDALCAAEAVLASADPESWLAIDCADDLATARTDWRCCVYQLGLVPTEVTSIVRAA